MARTKHSGFPLYPMTMEWRDIPFVNLTTQPIVANDCQVVLWTYPPSGQAPPIESWQLVEDEWLHVWHLVPLGHTHAGWRQSVQTCIRTADPITGYYAVQWRGVGLTTIEQIMHEAAGEEMPERSEPP